MRACGRLQPQSSRPGKGVFQAAPSQEPRQRLHQVPSRKLGSRCGAAKPKPAARIWAEPPNIQGLPDEASAGAPEDRARGEILAILSPRVLRGSSYCILGSPSQGAPLHLLPPHLRAQLKHHVAHSGLQGHPALASVGLQAETQEAASSITKHGKDRTSLWTNS